MKKQLLFVALLASFSGAAFADEGSFDGWYVGLNAAHTNVDTSFSPVLTGNWAAQSPALVNGIVAAGTGEFSPSDTGFGIQGGYDHQFSNNWVLGVAVDYVNIGGSEEASAVTSPTLPSVVAISPAVVNAPAQYTVSSTFEATSSWSARARVGYSFGNSLVYATAGWQSLNVDATVRIVGTSGYSKLGAVDPKADGFVWGAGWEYAFNDNWSVQLEYQRANLGEFSYGTLYVPNSAFRNPVFNETFTHELDMDSIKLGVNYRF
jgi:outer membrane immunogenic protein